MDIRRVDQQYNIPQRMETQAPARQEQGPQVPAESVSMGETPTEEPKVPKKWTILHYTAADNNLTDFMTADINEMEKVGSNDKMNIISLLDQGGSDCKLYYLTPDGDMSKINSPILKDMGNTDTADPKVLTNFITTMAEKYPSEHFAVIISDHGAGWKGAVTDDTSGTGPMTMPVINKALADAEKITGKKIDVLGFDACLMATGEVGYEIKDRASFMVASQETEGGAGWPYTPLLTEKTLQDIDRSLRERLDVSPQEFAEKMVTNAETHDPRSIPTLSAVDLTKMDKYMDSVNNFAQAILETDTPNATLKGLAQKTQKFYYSSSKDQFHFAELVSKDPSITDQKLKDAATGLMKTLKEDVIVANEHSPVKYPNAHGVTAEIPSYGGITSGGYMELQYAKNSLWEEAVNKFLK